MIQCVFVTGRGRFNFEFGNKVWPDFFRTGALFGQSLDAVADHSAGIGLDGVFNGAFVIVNEQPAEVFKSNFILPFQKLQRTG